MGLRDDVKGRRQARIRMIVERYNDSGTLEPGRIRQIDEPAMAEMTSFKKSSNDSMDFKAKSAVGDERQSKKLEQRLSHDHAAQDRTARDGGDFFSAQHDLQIDPELAWKKNPNPWAAWDKDDWSKKPPRSYVGASHANIHVHDGRDERDRRSGIRIFFRELKWKFLIALILFAAIWGIFRGDEQWAKEGQSIIQQAMKDEFDFDSVATWYQQLFAGAPSFIPIFKNERGGAALVDGQVKQTIVPPLEDSSLLRTFAELLNGIELAGDAKAQVVAVETGRVIQVSQEEDTVIIQHADNRVTIYGKLGETSVHVNDWVEAGDGIGKLREANESGVALLYLAVKQDNQYIDPVDVIPFD